MFKVGDRVTPAESHLVPIECVGRVFIVEKVNPKKTRCSAEDGGQGINFPHDLLVPATDENLKAKPVGRPFEPTEFFNCGEIVSFSKPWKDITTETPLVVINDTGKRIKVTRLGGDGGRYIRTGREGLVRRSADWLAEALLA